MRKTGMKVVLLMLGWSVLLASFAPQVKAQNDGEKTTTVYNVPIKNVRAEMMAYWLNREKQGVPTPIIKDKSGGTAYVMHPNFSDFIGIESITPDAAKNELLVKGTPESVRKLKMIVEFLDRPVKQVEIKVQFVEVDAAEMAGLGIEIEEEANDEVKTVSFDGRNTVTYGQNFRDKLRTLIEKNRAGVVQAAQVTAFNNLTTTVIWNTYPTLPQTDLLITPSILPDDTITVYLGPSFEYSTPLSNNTPKWLNSIVANVKKGDSFLVQTKQSSIEGRPIFLLVSTQVVQDKIDLLD